MAPSRERADSIGRDRIVTSLQLPAILLGTGAIICLVVAWSVRPVERPPFDDLREVRWLDLLLATDKVPSRCFQTLRPGCSQVILAAESRSLLLRAWADAEPGSIESAKLRLIFEAVTGIDHQSAPHISGMLDSTDTVEVWNALAASRFLEAKRSRRVSPLFRALDALDHAARLEPTNSQTIFNRSLVLERLGLFEESLHGWKELAVSDTDPMRKSESLVRLLHAMRTVISIDPVLNPAADQGGFEPESAFEEWTNSILALTERPDGWSSFCAQQVESGLAYGAVLAEDFGSRWPKDTMEWLEERCLSSPRVIPKKLEPALRALNEGWKESASSSGSGGADRLRSAVLLLERQESPLIWWAKLRHATEILAAERYGQSHQELIALVPLLLDRGYLQLAYKAHWGLGTVALRQGRPEEAIREYEAAIETVGDLAPNAAARLSSFVADAQGVLGDYEQAWALAIEALHRARSLKGKQRISAICSQLAAVSARADEWEAALLYQNCVVNQVPRDDPAYVVDAIVWRALTHYELEDQTAAVQDLKTARIQAARIGEPEERDAALATIDLVQGFAMQTGSPGMAREALARAAAYFERVGHKLNLIVAKVGLLDLTLKTIHPESQIEVQAESLAEPPAESAAVLIEDIDRIYRDIQTTTTSTYYSFTLLLRGSKISDRAVKFHLAQGRPWDAVAAGDRSRLRRGEASPSVIEVRALAANLESDTAILIYSWLDGQVVSYLLVPGGDLLPSRTGVQLTAETVATVALPSRWTDPAVWHRAAEKVHSVLVAPHLPDLIETRSLTIVPDGPLFGLPFAALHGENGVYLLGQVAVSIAPSISDLTAQPKGKPREPWNLKSLDQLAVFASPGSPMESQPTLGAVFDEATTVSQLLGTLNARVSSGEEATPSKFLQALHRADLIHFAGHSIVNPNDLSRSYLALSPDKNHPTGQLTAGELYLLSNAEADLVVLASCSSASSGAELPLALSLVRPLLEGGVDRVVGSTIALEDDVFRDLMFDFYSILATGATPEQALQAAQIKAMASILGHETIPLPGFVRVHTSQPQISIHQ